MCPVSSHVPESRLPVPVLIVEDDVEFQRRMAGLLVMHGYSFSSLQCVGTVAEALQATAEQSFALALVDLGLPDGNGIELVARLRKADAMMGILIISAWSSADMIFAALRAGATGYVLKERDDMELGLSIRSVLSGGAPIDPFIARRLIDELVAPAAPVVASDAGLLSEREKEILLHVASGLTNREIGEALYISRYTVESHIKHIYRKLAVTSRTQAVHEGRTHGLLS